MDNLAAVLKELFAQQRWDEVKALLSQKNPSDLAEVLPSLPTSE
jgi:hypothetical protein